MMKRFPVLLWSALSLAACQTDDSIAGPSRPSPGPTEWHLQSIDGQPFAARASLTFGQDGAIIGKAPCNSYSVRNTVDLPGLSLGPIRSTRRACPDLADEQKYIESLRSMTKADRRGNVLILSNASGREMVFAATNP